MGSQTLAEQSGHVLQGCIFFFCHPASAPFMGWRGVRWERAQASRRHWHGGRLPLWKLPGSQEPQLAATSFIHLEVPLNNLTALPQDLKEP